MNADDDEFRITLKVRNHPLLSAIEARSDSVADFCRRYDLSQSEVGEYLNLRKSPIDTRGEWRHGARRLADACGVTPEDLFPVAVQVALATNGASYTLAARDAAKLLEPDSRPDALLQTKEAAAAVQEVLATLNPREHKVLAYLYGLDGMQEHSLEQVGVIFDVSRERIRQIECKALRKLRHPSRSASLWPLLPEAVEHVPPPQDTFGDDAWLQQAIEQGTACVIPKWHRAYRHRRP